MSQLAQKTLPALDWIVPDIIPTGLTILAAAPKTGKSLFALDLGMNVSTGGRVLGRDVRGGPVVYLALEDSERRILERARKMRGDRLACDNLTIFTEWSQMGQTTENAVTELNDYLSTYKTRLVIVDTFGVIMATRSGTGMSFNKDYKDMRQLKELADRHGVGMLVIHHLRKEGATNVMDEISGTNGLRAAADTLMVLKRIGESKQGTLSIEGRDVETQKLHLTLGSDLVWRPVDEPERKPESADVLQYVQQKGEAHYKEVAQALGKSKDAAKKLLQRLRDDGVLETDGKGVYRLKAAEQPTNDEAA